MSIAGCQGHLGLSLKGKRADEMSRYLEKSGYLDILMVLKIQVSLSSFFKIPSYPRLYFSQFNSCFYFTSSNALKTTSVSNDLQRPKYPKQTDPPNIISAIHPGQ